MWKKSNAKKRVPATYIPGWNYIRRTVYPVNKYDTCGYTAACLLLNYYHNQPGPLQGKVIPKEFLDYNGKLLTKGYTLQDKLIQYASHSKTWAWSVANVLNCYFEEYGIAAKAHFCLFRMGAYARLKKGAPLILFGNLPKEKEDTGLSNRLNHAVVAYGLNFTKGVMPRFIVHYGWKHREYNILTNEVIGSYCFIESKL